MRQEKRIFQRHIFRVKVGLAFIYVESGSGESAALEGGDEVVVATNPPRAVFTTMAPTCSRLMALEFKK
jgi:hypothetical protein